MFAKLPQGPLQNWHSVHVNGMDMFAEIEATYESQSMNFHLPKAT